MFSCDGNHLPRGIQDVPSFFARIILTSFRQTVPAASHFWRKFMPLKKDAERCSYDDNAPSLEPVRLKDLFISPILISGGNYVSLALLDIFNLSILPLFCYTSIDEGGLGLTPSEIGKVMGVYGVSIGVFQFFFFARTLRALGERRTFLVAISMYILIFPLYPILSILAEHQGVGLWVYSVLGVMIALWTVADLAFGKSLIPLLARSTFGS